MRRALAFLAAAGCLAALAAAAVWAGCRAASPATRAELSDVVAGRDVDAHQESTGVGVDVAAEVSAEVRAALVDYSPVTYGDLWLTRGVAAIAFAWLWVLVRKTRRQAATIAATRAAVEADAAYWRQRDARFRLEQHGDADAIQIIPPSVRERFSHLADDRPP